MKRVVSVRWIGWVVAAAIAMVAPAVLTAEDAPGQEWKAPARAARRKNPIPADQKSIEAGKTVYTAQCVMCHGPKGLGDGPQAKDLTPKPRNLSDPNIQSQTDGSIFWKLTEGKKPMPSFEKLVSENDRWNVINYVRTFKRAK
jgi:mono/diheme cytochrome c family protein